jgi:hypothetical protein
MVCRERISSAPADAAGRTSISKMTAAKYIEHSDIVYLEWVIYSGISFFGSDFLKFHVSFGELQVLPRMTTKSRGPTEQVRATLLGNQEGPWRNSARSRIPPRFLALAAGWRRHGVDVCVQSGTRNWGKAWVGGVLSRRFFTAPSGGRTGPCCRGRWSGFRFALPIYGR